MEDTEEMEDSGQREILLKCTICAGTDFSVRSAALNSALTSASGLYWDDTSGTCYVCQSCGYVHWFLPRSHLRNPLVKIRTIDEFEETEEQDYSQPESESIDERIPFVAPEAMGLVPKKRL